MTIFGVKFRIMTIQSNANIIKAHFINAIIGDKIKLFNNKFIIGQEIMYGSNKMLVDLLLINEKGLIAIEIKSENDNTLRLSSQIENYKLIYDYTYVIVTNKHIKHVTRLDDKSFGIILLENDKFEIIRKPLKNKEISKQQILDSMPGLFLKKKFALPSKLTAYEVRTKLERKSLSCLKETLREYYLNKLEYLNQLLIPNKEVLTHFEDVSILSMDGLEVKL